jgi:hypothetical protein
MTQRRFHTTNAAEAILAEGFQDATGSYGLASRVLTGVFVSDTPANVNDGAKGEDVLEILLPDDVDLGPYAIKEGRIPVWEWCVPGELLNGRAVVRLSDHDQIGL